MTITSLHYKKEYKETQEDIEVGKECESAYISFTLLVAAS